MNLDSPVHSFSYPNDEPPTPIKTPTSSAFGQTPFQTPKIESSFYDPRVTWNTSDPYASSPEVSRTPRFVNTTTPVRPAQPFSSKRLSTGLGLDIDRELASHVHHPSPNPSLSLPPVEPSRQLSSSPNPNSAKRKCLDASDTAESPNIERNHFTIGNGSSAASMQTPPPTSTTKRRGPDFFPLGEDLASINSRRMSSPNVSRKPQQDSNSYPIEASPQMFSNLQFSPDIFQYPLSSGPATAPVFPQHRLFWDNDGGMQGGIPHVPQVQGQPYTANGPMIMDPFTSPQPMHHPFSSPNGYQMHTPFQVTDSQIQGPTFRMPSAPPVVDGAIFPTPFVHASPQQGRVVTEDPGLFLSSPARRFGPIPEVGGSSGSGAAPQQQLQPYFYQNEESKREKELEKIRKVPNKRNSIVSNPNPNIKAYPRKSSPPMSEARPGIKRSVTHTGVTSSLAQKRQSQVSFADSVSSHDWNARPPPGRLSPIKLDSYAPQLGSEPRTRTSLAFMIDEHGRAKTVTKVIAENDDDRMDLDASSGDSDSDLSDAGRNASFSFPEPHRRKTKLGQLQTSSIYHSKNSSYSSTGGSSGFSRTISAPNSVHRTQRLPAQSSGPFKQPALPPSAQHRMTFGREPPSEAETIVPDTGDAQHALKQLMKERIQPDPRGLHAGQRHSYAGPESSGNYGFGIADTDSSPTTITDPDVATPSTDRGSNMSGSTRCICNSNDNGGHLMIQCESCSMWLHTRCIGLDRKTLPPVYVCVYCSSTPMRGGRIREPVRATGQIPASPLAHKSHRWR